MSAPVPLPPDAVQPEDAAAWRAWLDAHHETSTGVWLVTWRKAAGRATIGYDAAVAEALAVGWVDSRPRALDAERTMLWFSPRQPRSGWSAPNKRRIEKLLAEGRMAPAGLAKVEAARRDGSWAALDAVEALEVPPDLADALAALPPAAENFAAFPRSARRGILEWIAAARRPPTRSVRVAETARLAQRNERANQWRPRDAPG